MAKELWSDDEWRAAMSTKEINDLPDSDFAYIEPGGEKDDDGKTVPRSLRHYPIHDADHVRNALARAGAAMKGDDEDAKAIAEKAMPKIKAAAKKFDIEVSDDEEGKSGPDSLEWRRRRAEQLRATERRAGVERIELREDLDGTIHLTGYASTTNTPYDMGWYSERVARGAFKKTLGESPDVTLNLNHGEAGSGLPIARTKAGNLKLSEDSKGLRVEAELDPQDPDVQLLARKRSAGNLDGQMSFAFSPTRQAWNDDYTEREIQEVSLHRGDVSIVTQGANPTTSSSLRSWDEALTAAMEMRSQNGGTEATRDAFVARLVVMLGAELGELRVGKKISNDTASKIQHAIDTLNDLLDTGQPSETDDDKNGTGDDDDGDEHLSLAPLDMRADRARLERLRYPNGRAA